MTNNPEPITEAPPAASTSEIIYLPPPPDLETPAKQGRRSGSEKRQRANKPVLVRLLPEERAAVEEKAATAGMSMAAYARACMLGDGGPRARKQPPVNRQLLARANGDLNRVGNNLNQIAHALNSRDEIAHSGEDDQPFRLKLITDSGDRDHADHGR